VGGSAAVRTKACPGGEMEAATGRAGPEEEAGGAGGALAMEGRVGGAAAAGDRDTEGVVGPGGPPARPDGAPVPRGRGAGAPAPRERGAGGAARGGGAPALRGRGGKGRRRADRWRKSRHGHWEARRRSGDRMDGSKGGAVREGREGLTGGRGGVGGGGGGGPARAGWGRGGGGPGGGGGGAAAGEGLIPCERIEFSVAQTLTLATIIISPSGLWARPIYTGSTQIANRDIRAECLGPWMLAGDFNLIYKDSNRNNNNFNRAMMGRFRRLIEDMALKEIPLHGRQYT
jgi:hypothetical protein